MKFTEARLEQAIIDLLGNEGYPHVLGETVAAILDGRLVLSKKMAISRKGAR